MKSRGYLLIPLLFLMITCVPGLSQIVEPIHMIDSYGPYDENGKSNGLWTFIYSDGTKGYCTFLSGYSTGHWIRYWPNGRISSLDAHEFGRLNGFSEYYDSLGNIVSLSYYKDDFLLYHYKYYPIGIIKEYREYIVDTTDIGVISYDPYTLDSSFKTIRELASIEHGTWKFYDEKGVLIREERYVRGVRQE